MHEVRLSVFQKKV